MVLLKDDVDARLDAQTAPDAARTLLSRASAAEGVLDVRRQEGLRSKMMRRSKHESAERNDPKLTWAITPNGTPTHISEAERGLKCGCICPLCRKDLVARQGKVMGHHFAHAKGAECAHAVETALHLAAKDILAKRREIVLPAVEIRFQHSSWHNIIAKEQRYEIESVVVEQKLGSIIP